MATRLPMTDAERKQRVRRHVFSVNGSAVFLDVIRELLEEERYNITTTNFVPRTHDQIVAVHPDLLIVDLVVGVASGWALLEELSADPRTAELPVIVTSTDHRLLADPEQLAHEGSDQRFLLKPFDVDALVALVNELIGPAETHTTESE